MPGPGSDPQQAQPKNDQIKILNQKQTRPKQRRESEPYGPTQTTQSIPILRHHESLGGIHSAPICNMEELFYCLLCIDKFTKPKILNCQHIFCDQCLDLYYKTYQNDHRQQMELSILCPTCRKPTKVPSSGIPDVSEAKKIDYRATARNRKMSAVTDISMQKCEVCFYSGQIVDSEYYCIKCAINVCAGCRTQHSKEELFKSHQVIHISNKETVNLYCDTHNRQQCEYFCLDCNIIACTICLIQQHGTHHNTKLREAQQMQRDNIKTLLNVMGPKLDKIDIRIERFQNICPASRRISNGSSRFDSTTLERNNSNLNNCDSDSMISEGSSDIDVQLLRYHQRQKQLRSLYEFSTKLLETSFSKKMLALYDDLMARIQTATEMELKQLAEDIGDTIDRQIQNRQSMSGYSNIDSDQMHSISSNEDCHLIDENIHTGISPRSLLIKPRFKWKVEKQRSDPGELWNPCDVAFLPDNMLVVAEYDVSSDRNNRIQIFDTAGNSYAIISEEKLQPLGVCIAPDGDIAVTDCQEKRIKKYTTCGIFSGEFGKGQFGWPYGIATTSHNQYVVTDAFNDIISIHQPDGRRIKTFGSSGPHNKQFKNPYHVTVDKHDNIIVSDCGNNCVKVFDINGRFMYKTSRLTHPADGSFAFEKGSKKLKSPRGVAVDPKGNILVADDHGRVSMFNTQGKYIRSVLTEEDTVKFPEGLATNSMGYLAVTEWNPHNMSAIKVFCMYE